ncbi:neuropeptide SIFamide receptor-like [Penaeus chinensis]|uniref:neuropeptide SIFamide receptor-like n=1 Tax=Penaeus chinensis TaxID=139456 RepID=UPI001FB6779E|nr:neuropeptide SIFamide receptor-like [Penaeus chinensis]
MGRVLSCHEIPFETRKARIALRSRRNVLGAEMARDMYRETVSGYRPGESVIFTPGSSSFAVLDTTYQDPFPYYRKTSPYPPLPLLTGAPSPASFSPATATQTVAAMTDFFYNTSDSANSTSIDDAYNNQTVSSDSPVFPEYIRVVSTIFCSIVLFVGVVGNVLVPVVILKNRDMRNSTNYFLINLSFADLLVLLICLPSVLVELHSPPDVWVLGYSMCKY